MNNDILRAIDKAIGNEKEAYDFYIGLMNSSDSHNLRELFKILALQEMKHESLLKELRRTGDLRKARQQMEIRYSLEPDFSFSHSVSTVGLQEGFRIAIEKEILAEKNYLEAAKDSDSDDLQLLFKALYEEEKRHEEILRTEYTRIFG